MKTAVCTGISGSGRIDYLREVQSYAKEQGNDLEIINMWEVVNEISDKPIDEATILNIPTPRRMQLFEDALKEIAKKVEEWQQCEKGDNEKYVAIATHACFHWKSTYLEAFPYDLLSILHADIFVTIVHNMKDIKENLENNANHRFVGIKHSDILDWQDHEIMETQKWAKALNKYHYVVAKNEPPQTLYRLLFQERTKKIYFSYPMSFVDAQQIEEAKKLIKDLREAGYIVFDPGSVDDAKYVDELIASDSGNTEYQDLGKRVDDQTVKQDYLLIEQSELLIGCVP